VDAKAVYGTNANGDYIKFDNGVLICHNTVNAIAGTTLQTISGLTFPLPFVGATPEVQVTHRSVSGKFANWYVSESDNYYIQHRSSGSIICRFNRNVVFMGSDR
jgi:hypothetical protein